MECTIRPIETGTYKCVSSNDFDDRCKAQTDEYLKQGYWVCFCANCIGHTRAAMFENNGESYVRKTYGDKALQAAREHEGGTVHFRLRKFDKGPKLYLVMFDTQREGTVRYYHFYVEATSQKVAISKARSAWAQKYLFRKHTPHQFHCEAHRVYAIPEGFSAGSFKVVRSRPVTWGNYKGAQR